jgi:carotenoid cleavage dioxygenase-like enzyme
LQSKRSLIYFLIVEIKAIDPATVARLSGIFTPIQDEIDVGPLEVVQGSIPRELTGVYLRTAWRAGVRAGRPAAAEDQGYVVTFATDAATLQSYFLILHAGDIAGEPAAILRIPSSSPSRIPRLLGPWELTYNVEELRHYFCNWRVVDATVL